MTILFTCSTLATLLGGAALATALVVHAAGQIPWIKHIQQCVVAFAAATAILAAATGFQGGLHFSGVSLLLLNGLW